MGVPYLEDPSGGRVEPGLERTMLVARNKSIAVVQARGDRLS